MPCVSNDFCLDFVDLLQLLLRSLQFDFLACAREVVTMHNALRIISSMTEDRGIGLPADEANGL